MATVGKITTNLWFDNQAEEAARFYTSIFNNSSIGRISRYGKEGYEIHGRPEGSVMTVEFEIEGQGFLALNGGPHFKFTEAISFIVNCDTQAGVDYFWEKLSEGGDPAADAMAGDNPTTANPFVSIPIVTGIGYARNPIVVKSSRAVIAVDGSYGTLTEIAYAIQHGIPVIGLNTWSISRKGEVDRAIIQAENPVQAVELALDLAD